ncbi:MAG: 30S ribosomal protein S17 [Parachlamydiaceae bacterium]
MEQQVKVSRRKRHKGVVVSNKMEKTVVVKLERTMQHPRYSKIITRAKKIYAHNEDKPLQIGDVVEVEETRPLSKLKRWRVVA